MIKRSVSLKYEPSSEPLHVSAKQLFLPVGLDANAAVEVEEVREFHARQHAQVVHHDHEPREVHLPCERPSRQGSRHM